MTSNEHRHPISEMDVHPREAQMIFAAHLIYPEVCETLSSDFRFHEWPDASVPLVAVV